MDAQVRIIDPKEVLKASARFDLIYKVELAKAWADGDAAAIREAEEAYLEMVRARNGFYEDEPRRDTPKEFLESFRRTANSIRERGYDLSRPPIPVDERLELLNGAHRLAACIAYGKTCPFVLSDCWKAGGSVWKTFHKGHIHPAVEAWGIRRYLEMMPDGALAAAFGRLSGAASRCPLRRARSGPRLNAGCCVNRRRFRVTRLWPPIGRNVRNESRHYLCRGIRHAHGQ